MSNVPFTKSCENNTLYNNIFSSEAFWLLLLLFILLAAAPLLGIESRYIFVIIMTIIGLGGFNKAFGI